MDDDYEDALCAQCNGSGEGMWDGSTCLVCKGRGEVRQSCDAEAEADFWYDRQREED